MKRNPKEIVFIDTEIDSMGSKVLDIGAVTGDGREFHSGSLSALTEFLRGHKYVCGHNIIRHDATHIKNEIADSGVAFLIDTLHLSPLLFPKKPYHRLVKDDKLNTDELNNPLSDAKKARDLFYEEVTAFDKLDKSMKMIYANLMWNLIEFKGFIQYIGIAKTEHNVTTLIRKVYKGKICDRSPIDKMESKYPAELAYSLAIIGVMEHDSISPPWVLRSYPRTENIVNFLRSRNCNYCDYCEEHLNEIIAAERFFGFKGFRSYDGEPLQQSAIKAAIAGKSILAVFPTGGGKSVTFQLPALMAGENEKGLTVVISPLQSLMKDQTDNLEINYGINSAVTINGSLDPIERMIAIERVENGSADILYISPESLRTKSIETLLLKRNVVRFVIDEAHCFSTWGHDFRVDYLYIGDFIKNLIKKKGMPQSLPVSCFTATAKKKVISDICQYFSDKLSLDLEVFTAKSERKNLSFHILSESVDDDKMRMLRQLLYDNDCPTIIYASRVRTTYIIANALTEAGIPAKPYNGKMDRLQRTETQDEFMRGELRTIVATTAFGMGVDKKDVGMVIHYDISQSVEDYVQEAGRAGRDESIEADCYVLYGEDDLNKHFLLLNQTKITQKEIRQIWRAIKNLTGFRESISQSALEIAREAGWDDTIHDMETRVRTAISALEQSGFVKRGQNMPRVFADSILVANAQEATSRINESVVFDDVSREYAIRIIKNLISAKSKARGADEDGESYVDYISDRLGIEKADVIRIVGLLREEGILADAKDLVAFIKGEKKRNQSEATLNTYHSIERFLIKYLVDEEKTYNLKEMNEALEKEVPEASIKKLDTIINLYDIKQYVKRVRRYGSNYTTLIPQKPLASISKESDKLYNIAKVIVNYLYSKVADTSFASEQQSYAVEFSVLEMKNEFALNLFGETAEMREIEDALYYLQKIGAMNIDGGFLVMYNAMRIDRLEKSNKALYNKGHYTQLDEFYKNKRQQIHIVGEYAKRLIDDYQEAIQFVDDYFVMDYDLFLHKYFKGRSEEMGRNITPAKFKQLFGELSTAQLKIINDKESRYIVVAAGPGSGKTKLLTHKLASIYHMEDVKHEQMLMLTFSRASATEFKKRLKVLIGNAANFISIMTFHSYCFDLLGRVGDLGKSKDILELTVDKIKEDDIDISRLTKSVVVIDEAQDMSQSEFKLLQILIEKNNEMKIIAVGDDDQNIYEFRGSSSTFFSSLAEQRGAKQYELLENYRSCANLVEFANNFAKGISSRMKSNPIMPVSNDNGAISIYKFASANIIVPVVSTFMDLGLTGSTCIATRTNAQALNILGLLTKKGVSARLIQSNNDFNIYDLVEIRDFIEFIDSEQDGYVIDEETWQNAIAFLNRKHVSSTNLQSVFKLIRDFEETSRSTLYKSDFKQYIRESKLEELETGFGGVVLVSTIHQTKGREFDNVFLALSGASHMDEAEKRAVYVAITRAKKNLNIFCNRNFFDKIDAESIVRTTDNNEYPEPSLIVMQLTHRDVALSHFARYRREIDKLICGQELGITETGCTAGGTEVLRFSKGYKGKMAEIIKNGYTPVKSAIRFIVYWQDKEMDKEIKIILPDIEFERME